MLRAWLFKNRLVALALLVTLMPTSAAAFRNNAGFGQPAAAAAPTIQVTANNGGVTWSRVGMQTITWTSSNVSGNVKVEYSSNSGTTWTLVIEASIANSGSVFWRPCTTFTPLTTTGRLRVSSVDDPAVNDTSDSDFTLSGGCP